MEFSGEEEVCPRAPNYEKDMLVFLSFNLSSISVQVDLVGIESIDVTVTLLLKIGRPLYLFIIIRSIRLNESVIGVLCPYPGVRYLTLISSIIPYAYKRFTLIPPEDRFVSVLEFE